MPRERSMRSQRGASSKNHRRTVVDDDFIVSDTHVSSSSEEEEEALYDDDVDDTEKSIPTRTRRSRKTAEKYISTLKNELDDSSDTEKEEETMEVEESSSAPKPTTIGNYTVLYKEDALANLRCDHLLFKQSLPIAKWIPVLERMNSRYIRSGSLLHPDRLLSWQALPENEKQQEVEMYLVKWRGLSYLHCSWETRQELTDYEGPHMKQKLQRYDRIEMDVLTEVNAYGTDVFFNPEFVEVDRVLDARIVCEDLEKPQPWDAEPDLQALLPETECGTRGCFVKEFLVKWKGIQYSDISWEVFEDFQDRAAIDLYYKHLKRDVSRNVHSNSYRPSLAQFKKVDASTEYKGGNTLRSYQIEGINWLTWNWANRRNSILADEMGLGKTVQSTMFMYNVLTQYLVKPPFLVVAPLSTLPHWEGEIRRWTDMHVVVLHGSVESRENILKYEWRSKAGEFDVLLTTYEICIVESALLASIPWSGIVVDEAHRLKGKNNKLGDVLRKMEFGCKLLLTGTPLQNNTEELWSLLNFLQPERFEDLAQFQADFGDMKDASQLEKLHDVLKPYMLRRMKEDVEKSLKPKEETVINVELTALQKKFYRAVYDHNTSVFVGNDSKNLPSLMNIMMELRKCCNHPFLIRGVEAAAIRELCPAQALKAEAAANPSAANGADRIDGVGKLPQTTQDLSNELALKCILGASGKMVLLDKLLPKLKAQGHKVLLFSQMVRMLDIIQDYLTIKGYAFERIDGGVKIGDRQASIDRFSAPNSDRFIFLICTRAGGFGINLTAADTVIIYDSDWNPQNDIQAQARCHRIGQAKAVNVYRLITNRTYEMEMFQRANLKLGLDKAVLNPLKQSIRSDGSTDMAKMTKKDAETLLKYGAYDFFKEEREGRSDELSNAFCEADIDQILEKNTKVITIDSQGGSSFSKASFITDSSMEVDINDPNFWTKVVGLKPADDLVMGPRSRKKVEYAEVEEEDAKNEVFFDDESEWVKADRDNLVKLLLQFGWGQWEPIYNSERMQKHPRSSIRLLCEAIVGQLCTLTRMIEGDCDLRKMGMTAVKAAQAAKEAIVALAPSYDVCKVIVEEYDQSDDPSKTGFLHRYPALVREAAWLHKMARVCGRYLKHLSFLYRLFKDIDAFHIRPQQPVALPKPRRAVRPAPWWGMEEDRDSLLGTKKHGWGNWKAICEDPELCFKQKGVVYHNQKEEEEELIEGEGDADPTEPELAPSNSAATSPTAVSPTTSTASPTTPLAVTSAVTGAVTVVTGTVEETRFFPTTQLLMKRIRRLVDAMETALSKGIQSSLDCAAPSPATPKRPKKMSALFLGSWTIKETKAIRNALLQWGLPLPPSPAVASGKLFTLTAVPLAKETLEREAEFACVCDVVDEMIRSVVSDNEPKHAVPTLPNLGGEPTKSAREVASAYPYHRCPTCQATDQKYCLYCDLYIYLRVLKIEANVLYKSYSDVQFITRYIEENAVKITENPPAKKPPKKEAAAGAAPEVEKGANEVETVIPSVILAQRIYSRLQLFYDLQQLVWRHEHRVLQAFMKRWMTSGLHHQDNVTKGWSPPIHDVALLEGIYRWGVVEWDVLWRDPLLPFYIDENEEHRRKEASKKRGGRRGRPKADAGEPPALPQPPQQFQSSQGAQAEEAAQVGTAAHESRPQYTLEDAKEKKDPSVNRAWLVGGLPSLYVLKRVNAILRFFKQWRSVGVVTRVNEAPMDVGVVIGDGVRRVGVMLGGQHRMTAAEVRVVEEVFWKKNQKIAFHLNYPTKPAAPTRRLEAWGYPTAENELLKAPQAYYKQFYPAQAYPQMPTQLPSQMPAQLPAQLPAQMPAQLQQLPAPLYPQLQQLQLPAQNAFAYPYAARAPFGAVPAQPALAPFFASLAASVAVKQPAQPDPNAQYFRESRAFLQSVQLPLKVKGVTVLSFGRVVTQWKSYHNAKYIWPVGFKSTRMYYSFKNPQQKVLYTSEIIDGGSDGPRFMVTAEDAPEEPLVAATPSAAWQYVLGLIREERMKNGITKSSISISGPDSFGFSYPDVAYCIEGLEGADQCKEYICRKIRDMQKTRSCRAADAAVESHASYKEEVNLPVAFAQKREDGGCMIKEKRVK
ncbi:hypothetical protein WA556_002950, partial [Blastocystis sp. ATCC 50177/Nand II]